MRFWVASLGVLALVAGLSLAAFASTRTDDGNFVVTSSQDLPDDVLAEIETVQNLFDERAPGRIDKCDPEINLLLVSEVTGGDARYLPADRLVEIEIPTSPRRFRDSLVHEIAHHLDETCQDADELRREWLSQDPLSSGWTDGVWEDRPSELYAETVVQAILDERARYGRTMPLPGHGPPLVASWLVGDPL